MGKTLDYDSVAKWVSLTAWATKEYEHWEKNNPEPHHSDYYYTMFLRQVATEALNRGFSLRAGYRADAVREVLKAIAPTNDEVLAAFDRIDKESWLTPPGVRKERNQA